MIPTFLIDEPVLVSIGLLAGYFIPKDWTQSPFRTRAFAAGSMVTFGFMGMAYYGYRVAPDWMFMYLLPANAVPAWVVAYIFLFYYLLFVLGFLLGSVLARWHRRLLPAALSLGVAGSILVILPLRKAYQTVATFEAFHRGEGIPLSDSALGKHILLPTLLLLVAGILLFLWAGRQSEKNLPDENQNNHFQSRNNS